MGSKGRALRRWGICTKKCGFCSSRLTLVVQQAFLFDPGPWRTRAVLVSGCVHCIRCFKKSFYTMKIIVRIPSRRN